MDALRGPCQGLLVSPVGAGDGAAVPLGGHEEEIEMMGQVRLTSGGSFFRKGYDDVWEGRCMDWQTADI